MDLGDVIQDLKHIQCKENEFRKIVTKAFKDYGGHDIQVGENGKDYFYDKRFDIDYQVTFNTEGEPAVKMKVEKGQADGIVKVVDAWV
jgi:hypothetical protein